MKRHLLFFVSAITLGALTGFLITDLPRHAGATRSVRTAFKSAPGSPETRAQRAADASVMGRFIVASTAVVDRVRGREKATSVGLLLNERVVVVHSGGEPQVSLPEGTRVALLKSEGRFLRVQHEQTVVTIPRSAVVAGVTRTN